MRAVAEGQNLRPARPFAPPAAAAPPDEKKEKLSA